MIKDFTTYHQALKLKELGFNEPCVAFFQKEYNETRPILVDDNDQYRLTGWRTCKNSEIPEHYTSAPTFSQAFRFFREKYRQSHIWIMDELIETGEYTYEEAELACLNKLITSI